jgi:hypothetical protein
VSEITDITGGRRNPPGPGRKPTPADLLAPPTPPTPTNATPPPADPNALVRRVANEYFAPPPAPGDWFERHRIHLTSGQRDVLTSLSRNRYTVVPSAHDVGKSFLAAAAACQWIDEHAQGDAFVVSTAPTSPQVTAILWREIEKLHRRLGLKGQINMGRVPEWKIGKELVGYGRKPADYDESGFQGIHQRYVLIVVDEAAGIPEQLWTAVDALATNEAARVLAIGNPDEANSRFRYMCLPGSGWNTIRLDGLASPNFTQDEVKAASNIANQTGDLYQYMVDHEVPFSQEQVPYELTQVLLSPRWVAERMISWGVSRTQDGDWSEPPLWESRVRATFPTDSTERSVVPLSWVRQAMQRGKDLFHVHPDELVGTTVIGVDVARYGEDETAVSVRRGRNVLEVARMGHQDTQTTALRVAARMDASTSGALAVVDVIGVGAGVVDRLREIGHEVISYNASAKTTLTDSHGEFTFPNARSAAWWNMRELLDPQNPNPISLPDDEILAAELSSPRWRILSGAKIQVEPKEDTKKRIRRSPDSADAVIMSLFYFGVDSGNAFVCDFGGESEYVTQWS